MNTQQTIRERVEAAHLAWADASHKKLKTYMLSAELAGAREMARAELAQARGWKFTKRSFTVGALLRGSTGGRTDWFGEHQRSDQNYGVLDHCEYLKRGRRPVAILTHSYATREQIEEFARRNALLVEYLPYSWYYPGGCTAALLTPAVQCGGVTP